MQQGEGRIAGAADVGGTNTRVGLVREDGKVVNDEDEVVGQVVEGSYKKLERLVGKKVTPEHTIFSRK